MTDSSSLVLNFKNHLTQKSLIFGSGLHIIYGESGSGKSELIRCISQNSTFVLGKYEVYVDDIYKNINVIHQNPDLQIVSNTIQNELAFNFECNSNDSDFIKDQLDKVIERIFFNVDLNRHPATLSGGEKELLNILTTFSLNPKIVFLDDSLSFLSNRMKRSVVNYLAEHKHTVILWFTSDERDLQYGNSNYNINKDGINKIESLPKSTATQIGDKFGEIGLDIKNLSFKYNSDKNILKNFSIAIERFRCLGISGNNGSGKSTLACLFLNIIKPVSGSINLNHLLKDNLRIGYLDQFPEKLLGMMTIGEFAQQLIDYNKLDIIDFNLIISDLLLFDIIWDEIKSHTGLDLSWTQLRIILICILSNSTYDLLILDEPTFGMGQQQKLNLRSYLIRYLDKKHLILISHDNSFLNSLCDELISL